MIGGITGTFLNALAFMMHRYSPFHAPAHESSRLPPCLQWPHDQPRRCATRRALSPQRYVEKLPPRLHQLTSSLTLHLLACLCGNVCNPRVVKRSSTVTSSTYTQSMLVQHGRRG